MLKTSFCFHEHHSSRCGHYGSTWRSEGHWEERLPVNTPVPAQSGEYCSVGSDNCKVWAETVGRRDKKTVSGHASETLTQTAISPKCNDHVLREQQKYFWHYGFVKTGERHMLWYVCGFVCFGHTPATSTVHQVRMCNYSKSGQTFVNILQREVQAVWSEAEAESCRFHTDRLRQRTSSFNRSHRIYNSTASWLTSHLLTSNLGELVISHFWWPQTKYVNGWDDGILLEKHKENISLRVCHWGWKRWAANLELEPCIRQEPDKENDPKTFKDVQFINFNLKVCVSATNNLGK